MFSRIINKIMDQVSPNSKPRVRYNSFEIDESDQQPSDVKGLILELQQYFPEHSEDFTDTDIKIEASKITINEEGDESADFKEIPLYKEAFIAKIRKDMRCLELLKSIRSLMEESRRDAEVVNWDLIVKEGFKVQCYLTFVYTMMRLIDLDPSDRINRDLAFNTGRTYICLLGLPGAKRCLVWDPELATTFFKLFSFNHQLTNNLGMSDYDDHYLEIQIFQMLNECKNAFNVVCLSDQEDVLEKYIEAISSTLEYFLTSTKKSSHEIIMHCYENLEALCLKPLPDTTIENFMYLIFCRTVELHFIPPRRGSRISIGDKHGEKIFEFFVYLLTNYTEKTKNVLTKFIKSLLSNLEHKFDREKFQKLFDVAVKYELAVFWKSGESIVEYLENLSLASDPRHRLNGVDFCGRMLLLDSDPDPTEQFASLIIPREAFIIKILFEKVCDKQDNVRLKALTALKTAIINGNSESKKIFASVFKKNGVSSIEILGEEAENFQNNLLSLLQTSQSTYIRKTCLEILAQHCDNLLDNEIFVDTLTNLTDDPSYLVKMQLIDLINNLLMRHSKNKNVMELWLEIILTTTRDNDTKIVDAAVKSSTAIFQKIETFENTINDEQQMPWNIIRLVMSKGKKNLLQSAINGVSTNFLSQDRLRKIETHIFTSNKSEAWCLLSILAKKMKSNNPDIVVKTFLDHIERFDDPSFDASDFHLIVEVIKNWTKSFSNNSKNQIVYKLSAALESGKFPFSFSHHLYEIYVETRKIISGEIQTAEAILFLHGQAQNFILDNRENFISNSNSEKFLCYLLIYSETSTDLPRRPDARVIAFMLELVKQVLTEKLKMSLELDVPRKLNCCIIILTRFAIRDNELASEVTPLLAQVLRKKTMNMSVVKTVIKCLNDLCKKHTSTVAPVFKEIIYKLHSNNEEIRLCALENIYELVMQDFIKMKGRVLLNFLACLVDKNEIVQLRSQAAILSYTNDKNPNLLYTCFLESVFLFNDFIQSENMGVFPVEEIDRNLRLLYGAEKRDARLALYNFFVQNIHDLNEVHLLMLLKQIIVIKEKLEKKIFKTSANGVEAFKDLLLVFKMICDKRGESKTTMSRGEAQDFDANTEENEDLPATTSAVKGGGRNKKTMTVNDAVPVIETMLQVFPAFSTLMTAYDKSLKPSIDELTKSIVQNFPTFLEFSKPDSFWHKAQNSEKQANKKKPRGKKRTAQVALGSDDDSGDE